MITSKKILIAQEELAKSELSMCCQTLCNKTHVIEYIKSLESIIKQQQKEIQQLKESIYE